MRTRTLTDDPQTVLGGGGGRTGGQGSAAQIASWVAAHYTAQTVGGVTVYDLTS